MIPLSTPELHLFLSGGIDYTRSLLIKALKGRSLSIFILSFILLASSDIISLEPTPDIKLPVFTRGFNRFVKKRNISSMDNCQTF